jgi:hypothetical protein
LKQKAEARRVGIEGSTELIFAHIAAIVNARRLVCQAPLEMSPLLNH